MDYEDFVKTTDLSNQNLQFYLDGMNEENGEISGIFKRVRRGDFGDKAKEEIDEKGLQYIIDEYPLVLGALVKEIGDRHWYTTRLLQKIRVTWKQVEQTNIDKLQKRKETNTIKGHGDNRENE